MTPRSKTRPSAIQRELRQTKPFPSVGQEAAVTLMRTADVLRQDLERTLEPYGITPQQYNVLRILRGSHPEPLPTLEIGERLVERAPGITRLLDRLEAAGLVSRARCSEDRRRVLVNITRAGLAKLTASDTAVNTAEGERVSRLARADLEQLIELLDRIREESS